MQKCAFGCSTALLFYCTVLFNSGVALAEGQPLKTNKAQAMPSDKTAHLQPIPPEQWDEEIMDALGAFPSSRDFVLGKWKEGSDDLRGRNTLGFLAHYPELAKAYLTLNRHVSAGTSLSFRDKEILILRTARLRRADNEFAQHIILGRRAGLSDTQLLQLIDGASAETWDSQDALLIRAADELFLQAKISTDTLDRLSAHFNDRQIMDMVFLAGTYAMLSSAINTFAIPLDSGMESYDPLIPVFLNKLESEN